MKNYEKIKNMSVEEMAGFMIDIDCSKNGVCDYCTLLGGRCGLSCEAGVRQWLESEATE